LALLPIELQGAGRGMDSSERGRAAVDPGIALLHEVAYCLFAAGEDRQRGAKALGQRADSQDVRPGEPEAARRAATAPTIRFFRAGLLAENAQRLGVVYEQQAALPACQRQVIAKRSVAAAGAAQPIGDDNRTAGGGAAKQPLERGGVMV